MDDSAKVKYNALLRQVIFLGILAAMAITIFAELKFFVGSFLGAVTIYIVIRNLMFGLVERFKMHKWIAALILVTLTGAVLAAFFWMLVKTIGSGIPEFNIKDTLAGINEFFTSLNNKLGINVIPDNVVRESDGFIAKAVAGILNTTYSFTANILMMLIILYFMLAAGRRMEAAVWKYIPFRDSSLCMIKYEVKTMIYSNAIGIPIILIAQTFVSTLIYWFLGFDNYWFWGFLTAICGLLPLLGTALVFIPVAIYLAVNGSILYAIILALYGAVIISNTDNLIRIILLRKVADTHPLIVIFGVILGIPLFGFWGIIFGPLLISGFILLVNIYYMEYGLLDGPPAKNICARKRKTAPGFFKKFVKHKPEPETE